MRRSAGALGNRIGLANNPRRGPLSTQAAAKSKEELIAERARRTQAGKGGARKAAGGGGAGTLVLLGGTAAAGAAWHFKGEPRRAGWGCWCAHWMGC